jgi:hypothetical protein
MSAFLLGIGFRADMGTCARKLVLLKLIDACEEDGTRIFPAISTIARAAQCSTRQVQRELQAFREAGLIRLVREGGKGPRSTNEYALDLDVLQRLGKEGWEVVTNGKGDTVSPLDHGEKGDTGDAERVTPETDKGDKLSHPTPPDPSLDPSIERDAREREQEDRKAVERWLKDTHRHWPSYISDSAPKAMSAALGLTPQERETASERMADYVAHAKVGGRTVICTFAVYLAEKRWEKLPPPEKRPAVADDYAPPFGPVWGAFIVGSCLLGKTEPLDALYRKARLGHGYRFGERWQALKAAMEPVPVGTPGFEAWRQAFEQHGWPWLPDPGDQPVVYFPAGGPERLSEFEAAIRGEDDAGGREAAE